MTFEASRKKQVLVLQPRGKALYEDESSFGSKMLAKMGWNKGSGLGKEQHGSLDFIQIRYKNNANGLGYDGLKDNQWTENESQFDNLLKSLNGNESPGNSGSADEQTKTTKKSLEEQSKSSRARVHYKKFTRGKDVHKYSEKDLANILGKKTLNEVEKEPEIEEVVDDKPDIYDSNLIVKAELSVADYFKQKMEAKKLGKRHASDESDNSEKIKKRKNKKKEIVDDIHKADYNQVIDFKTVKSSKKKHKLEVEEVLEDPEQSEPPEKKKKKKAKQEVVSEEPEINVDEIVQVESEKNDLKIKKKKSKKQKVEQVQVAQPEEETQLDPTPVIETKKSKKKAKKNREDESTEVIQPAEASSVTTKSSPAAGEPEKVSGANAVYSTNVIQIPSHVAQKMSCMAIENFKNANVANVVGYGLTEEIEIKTVQTKIGDNFNNTDKYSLYNMDRITTRQKTNPRKILSKLKRTKKAIQVI